MGDTIRLGRIAGIDVGVNWSWLVVFVLITWTLYSGVFPETNPDLSDGAHLAMAVAAAVLFFASLLLHEFGHALQARREGMTIEGITLWLFGGVARFSGLFPSAGAEFRIAVAGPLVSLVLGGGFTALALAGLPEALDGVSAWLGYTNLALLVFNLLPALPLDGGRVLRSALWASKRDFASATRAAVTEARMLAYGLIALGIALFIVEGAFSGAWLAFIGWFLLQSASAEARWVAARQALGGLKVRDLMVRDPVTVAPDLPLERFVDLMVARRYTTYPVVDGERAVGLVPFRCVAATPRAEWTSRTVRDCMLELDAVPRFRADDDLADAAARLSEGAVNRGLVLTDGRLAGLLSLTDVARALELRQLRATR